MVDEHQGETLQYLTSYPLRFDRHSTGEMVLADAERHAGVRATDLKSSYKVASSHEKNHRLGTTV